MTDLSSVYARFLKVNIWRIVITRLVSIMYVIIVARLISLDIQDSMIILAYAQGLIVQLSLFGIGVSAVYIGRAQIEDDGVMQNALKSTFMLSLPFVIASAFLAREFIGMSSLAFLLYVSAMTLQMIFEYLNIYNDYRLRSDRKVIGRTIYSVANSILVPTMFFFTSSLEGVLMAWNYAMIMSVLYFGEDLSALFIKTEMDFPIMLRILKTGMPIYLANWVNLIAQRMDVFLIYAHGVSGESAQYYWMLKISAIGQEMFMIMINGLFPLLVVASKERTREEFVSLTHSLMRVALLFGVSTFTMLIAYGRVAVWILLSDRFLAGLIILQLLILGRTINIPATILISVSNAEGKLRRVMWMSLFADGLWIVAVFVLLRFGVIGLAIAFIINRIIQSGYMLWSTRDIFRGEVRAYYRILVFVFLMTLLSFATTYVFIFLCPFILYATRPLHESDWVLIERVLPVTIRKFPFLKQFMVSTTV